MTVAAVVTALTGAARMEAEVPRDVWVEGAERTRPVAAVVASVVELVVPPVARSGQEETVAVRSNKEPAIHTILGRPCAGRVITKLLPFFSCWHTTTSTPVGSGSIILGQQSGQVVGKAVVTIAGIIAILSEC